MATSAAPLPAPVDLIVANLLYLAASSAAQHPDLLSEPAAAVFDADDGLEPYRRLVAAAAIQLADGGALLLQLNRRVIEASRSELPALRAALGKTVAGSGLTGGAPLVLGRTR